MTYFTVLIFEI